MQTIKPHPLLDGMVEKQLDAGVDMTKGDSIDYGARAERVCYRECLVQWLLVGLMYGVILVESIIRWMPAQKRP